MTTQDPAFPSSNGLATASGVVTQGHVGLTKRELFAMAAMPALLRKYTSAVAVHDIAMASYRMADAMIEAGKTE
jgi:hypothetical protein